MKLRRRLLGVEVAADRAGALDPERVEAAGDRHADQQPDRGDDLRGRLDRDPERAQAVVELHGEVLPQLALAQPVERDGADHHDDERDRAGHRVEARQPAEERAHADDAVPRLEHRHPREEVEVDRERLAPARPRLDAVDRHRGERQQRVAGHRGGERRGLLAPARGELDPGEHEQAGRGGPAAEPFRVGPAHAVAEQHAADRPPRVDEAEDVAEQHAHEHQPDPEDDEDEGRREVVQRRRRPGVAGGEHEREDRDAEHAAGDLHAAAAEQASDPAGQRPPARVLEPRLRPQRRQRDEGDAEHDRRRPPEQPLRDRQARALHEPVGEDGDHRAVLSARSKAPSPKDPSSRAVTLPSAPTTNSQGSVGRLNCCSGSRRPLFGSLSA